MAKEIVMIQRNDIGRKNKKVFREKFFLIKIILKNGYFKVVEVRTQKGFMVSQTLVSQKGLDYIINLMLKDGFKPRC